MKSVSLVSYWEMKNEWGKDEHLFYCSVNGRSGTAYVVQIGNLETERSERRSRKRKMSQV